MQAGNREPDPSFWHKGQMTEGHRQHLKGSGSTALAKVQQRALSHVHCQPANPNKEEAVSSTIALCPVLQRTQVFKSLVQMGWDVLIFLECSTAWAVTLADKVLVEARPGGLCTGSERD